MQLAPRNSNAGSSRRYRLILPPDLVPLKLGNPDRHSMPQGSDEWRVTSDEPEWWQRVAGLALFCHFLVSEVFEGVEGTVEGALVAGILARETVEVCKQAGIG